MNRKFWACVVLYVSVVVGLSGSSLRAATITTASQTSPYVVSNTDLLQTAVTASTPSPNAAAFTQFGSGGLPVLTDGTIGAPTTNSFSTTAIVLNNSSVVYTLNTGANPLGYRITSINTYGEWDDGRDRQDITVAYSTIANPSTFIDIATYSFEPNTTSPNFSLVSVTPNVGESFLATGVAALRFTFPNQENAGGGYREFDVFGQAFVVPEPGALALWILLGAGGLAFAIARRRRRN